MATAVYPGSFDPVTKGHLDIIKRAAKINDHLIVAVLINSAKHPLFTVEERVVLLQECCKDIPNVSVESFDGLTVEFAKKRHASVMVRGLRAVTDFEDEIQLAQTNHALMPGHRDDVSCDQHQMELSFLDDRERSCPLRQQHLQVRHPECRGRRHQEDGRAPGERGRALKARSFCANALGVSIN